MTDEKNPYPVAPEPVNYQAMPQPMNQPQPQTTTVVIQQPAVFAGAAFYGKNPQPIVCPSCKANVITRISHNSGLGTWLICLGLCLIGCDLGCCFIPFCVDSAKDVKHHCPNCNVYLGERKLL